MSMRDRAIGNDLFTGERFAQLQPLAQLLFVGMVTLSNDLGQFKGNAFEFKMKLWPWGLVPMDGVMAALAECVESGIIVEFDDDCYFIPAWFKKQNFMKYYAASKLQPIPQDILDTYPKYRDAMNEAVGRSKVKRQESRMAASRRNRSARMDLSDKDRVADALKIEAIAEQSNDIAIVIEAVQRMAIAIDHHVTAETMAEYVEILKDLKPDQVLAAANQLKREKSFMCFPATIRQRVIDMFGEDKKKGQRERDTDELVKALAMGHQSYRSTLRSIPDKRKAVAQMDVWERMEAIAPRPLSVIVSDIYGDAEFTPNRIIRTWMKITTELKGGTEDA